MDGDPMPAMPESKPLSLPIRNERIGDGHVHGRPTDRTPPSRAPTMASISPTSDHPIPRPTIRRSSHIASVHFLYMKADSHQDANVGRGRSNLDIRKSE